MSNRRKIYGKFKIEGQFIGYRYEVQDSLAWKAMSYGARLLYLALLRRLTSKGYNNGKVYLATRKAAKQLGASQGQTCIWFRELEHYGFIVQTQHATLGPEGKSAHYRITDVGWGELDGKRIEATKDYLRWDGELFDRNRNDSASKTKRSNRRKNHSLLNGKTTHTESATAETPMSGKTTHINGPPTERKNHSYLELPSPLAVDADVAGIGHNLGPPLMPADDRLPWSTPTVTEIVGANPRLVIPDHLTIPEFMRRSA
jgi:hypothetical protein